MSVYLKCCLSIGSFLMILCAQSLYCKILKIKTMKNFKIILLLVATSFIMFSCNKNSDDTAVPVSTTVFNPNDYAEYLTCKVGDFNYNVGSNTSTSTVYAFKAGTILHLTSNDGAFIPGSTLPMQIKMQLKNFDAVNLKSYDVSSTYPSEILKYKHVDGDSYDTNNGINIGNQANAITITKIENGYYTGTFSFTTYKTSNRAITLPVSQGTFKFKL